MNNKKILLYTLLRGLLTLIVISALLFISAGTVNYSAAWLFICVLGISALFFSLWLFIAHPKQFVNRLNIMEPDKQQRKVLFLIATTICASLTISGIDKRFAWSQISDWRYLFSLILLCISTIIYVNVFVTNPFLSNNVKIHEGHKVVKSGMYGIVRHPMYLASCIAYAAGLIILGSWLSVPFYGIFIVCVYVRIEIEERLLLSSLPGYADYMKQVRHRMLPFFIFKKTKNVDKTSSC